MFDEKLYTRIDHADGRVEFVPKEQSIDYVPKEGEEYFVVDMLGDDVNMYRWNGDGIDDASLAYHNVFPTEKLALKAGKLMKYSNAIIRACLLVDPDYVPDWENDSEEKYCVYVSNGKFRHTEFYEDSYSVAYVSSEEKAEQVIKLLNSWKILEEK